MRQLPFYTLLEGKASAPLSVKIVDKVWLRQFDGGLRRQTVISVALLEFRKDYEREKLLLASAMLRSRF
jgi:hypothetical protein